MPLLLLGGLEIILRLSGYGYPTGFFEKIRGGEKEFLVNNENFIMRFFPPETARFHQSPTTLKLVAAAGCQRLFFPPYSPDLNPIEPLWAAFKTRLCQHLPTATNPFLFIANMCLCYC